MAIDDGLDWFHHRGEFSEAEYQRLLVAEVSRLRASHAKTWAAGAEAMRRSTMRVADDRMRTCLDKSSQDRAALEKDPHDIRGAHAAASERCAGYEARHIGELIQALPVPVMPDPASADTRDEEAAQAPCDPALHEPALHEPALQDQELRLEYARRFQAMASTAAELRGDLLEMGRKFDAAEMDGRHHALYGAALMLITDRDASDTRTLRTRYADRFIEMSKAAEKGRDRFEKLGHRDWAAIMEGRAEALREICIIMRVENEAPGPT